MSEPDQSQSDLDPDTDRPRTAVVWATVRPVAEALSEDAAVDVTVVDDGERAVAVTDETTDCLVTDVPVPGLSWREFVSQLPESTPVVLYTDRNPTTIRDAILQDVDSLVQREGSNDEFLRLIVYNVTREEVPQRRTDVERLESNRVAWFLVAEDGSVVSANREFETVFPAAEPAADAGFYERLTRVLADSPEAVSDLLDLPGSDRSCEGRLLPIPLATGGRRDLIHCSYPLPDAVGASRLELFEGVAGGTGDTDRLELLETLVMGAQDGLYTLDTSGEVTFCNPAAADLLEYDRDEIVGMHGSAFFADGELERGQRIIRELMTSREKDGTVCDFTFVTKHGDPREVSLNIQSVSDSDGICTGLVGVIRDVTERKARKRELERYETIIQALGDPVYAVDEDGEIIYVNEAFEEKTGYDVGTLLGQTGSVVLTEETYEQLQQVVVSLLKNPGTTQTVEVDILPKSGETFRAEVHTALLPPRDGEYHGTAGVVRDITHRQAREQELRRQNERLENFAEVISHDLRNPLNVAQLRLEQIDDEETAAVRENLDRMEAIIEDVLTLAREGQAVDETQRVDLSTMAVTAWEQVETSAATLRCVEDCILEADPARCGQLFENLFRNSLEHAGEDVTVRVGSTPDGFYVEDDGPGIPPDDRETVLQRGYSTADDGTGFGLAIVTEVAEAHGWAVHVTESDDGGARFEISGVSTA